LGLACSVASIKLSHAAFSCCTCRTHLKKENRLLSNMGSELECEIQMRMKILPPINASKLMRRSRSALQRAVMSHRSCSRCRMRQRS
jgi:hypothetical protein